MRDRYAVIGSPISHSRSPAIHAAFAAQTGQDLTYTAVLGPDDHFEGAVRQLQAAGLRGLNVTLPFKERALAIAHEPTARATRAGAANTLRFDSDRIFADNTDGAGLLRDLQRRLGVTLSGRRILILGAGGAVRGILGPLRDARPAQLDLGNRTRARAQTLVDAIHAEEDRMAAEPGEAVTPLSCAVVATELLAQAGPYDVVVNGTSGALTGSAPALPPSLFAPHAFAYDLAYRLDGDTPFLARARDAGVTRLADGLGMLVEQAAEAFFIWRGVWPETERVLSDLRAGRLTPP